MRRDLVIGIDSSTTATKAIAWDRRGRAIAEGRAPVAMSNPKPGWFEQEASDWCTAAVKALKRVTAKIDAGRVAAVAISNQRETFVQFDANGKALRPGTTWLDERAREQVDSLARALGADTIHRISGKPCDIVPCFPRCAWLAENMPSLWKKTAMTAEVHGVLVHYLTGEWRTSTASADPMGLVDMANRDWSETLLAAVSLSRAQVPELARPGETVGEITAAAARSTGLRAGTPVVAGGGDGQCAGTGTNVFAKGRAYINLGTAVVSGSFGKPYAWNRAFRTMGAVAEAGYIYESCIRSGTFLVNWMVERLFNVDPGRSPRIFAALEKEAAASPAGANGLALVPYWSGCMTPYWDTRARGVIAGLSPSHTRGDVYRSVMEGIALEQAMVTDRIAAATSPITHYVAIGGGANSDLWCQILADASDREVRRLATIEASSLGAGMAAAKGAGWFGTVAEAAAEMAGRPVKVFRPRRKQAAFYREFGAIHAALWPAVAEWNGSLAAFLSRSQR